MVAYIGSLCELNCLSALFWTCHRSCCLCPVLIELCICLRAHKELGNWERHKSSLLPSSRALMQSPIIASVTTAVPKSSFRGVWNVIPLITGPSPHCTDFFPLRDVALAGFFTGWALFSFTATRSHHHPCFSRTLCHPVLPRQYMWWQCCGFMFLQHLWWISIKV